MANSTLPLELRVLVDDMNEAIVCRNHLTFYGYVFHSFIERESEAYVAVVFLCDHFDSFSYINLRKALETDYVAFTIEARL